jgi:glycine dehydrogenase subunit 1
MSLLGEDGFKTLARLNHEKECQLADQITAIDGLSLVNETFFNEIAVKLPEGTSAEKLVQDLADQKIIAGYPANDSTLLIAVTEIATNSGIKALTDAIKGAL